MSERIELRPMTPYDMDFVRRVYASTREAELAVLDWSRAEKDRFLRMQFDAQHAYYQEQFAGASYDLILMNGEPIGRLYLDRRADEIRIIDIALLTRYRGRGIGSGLMRDILDQAAEAGLAVRIHVEHNNPALRLYRRLGFEQIDDQGVYYLMEWVPDREPRAAGGV